MTPSHYIANFFAGLFLCNCIPHLASGLRGERFPTPFATPHGIGKSSAVINFLWGSLNLFVGIALLAYRPIVVGINLNSALFVIAFLILGTFMSHRFEKVAKNKE